MNHSIIIYVAATLAASLVIVSCGGGNPHPHCGVIRRQGDSVFTGKGKYPFHKMDERIGKTQIQHY